jgi:DNA-binding MarR family transcriptional regulator
LSGFVYGRAIERKGAKLTKYSPDEDPGRPLPLQEKIGRIVEALASRSSAKAGSQRRPDTGADAPGVLEDAVAAAIEAWRGRGRHLPGTLLSDPAWGMLLELLRSETAGQQVSVARVIEASAAPPSTAMRWLKALEDHQLVIRRGDQRDQASAMVELTPRGSTALRRYFREMAERR